MRFLSSLALSFMVAACAGQDGAFGSSADELRSEEVGSVPTDGTDGPPVRHPCTSSFGAALTSGSQGRLDGILVAVVPPGGHACSGDAHHVHLQIMMQGAVYDVAVNVSGVDFAQTDAPLSGAPWSEGWHAATPLDYPSSLSLHSGDFAPVAESTLATQIADAVSQANHVSIFATKYSKSGIHLVHRNGSGNDGAIVLNPLSPRARYLVFHFPNQTF
jgi:hypothetical protein